MAKVGGAGAKKHGRDKDKCNQYRGHKMREQHKIVRIARSSGVLAAMDYARKNGLSDWARKHLIHFEFGRGDS